MPKYTVCASHTQESANSFDRCAVTQEFDTLKEAKAFARHAITDDFQALIESSAPMTYAKVERDGVCVADYFRK